MTETTDNNIAPTASLISRRVTGILLGGGLGLVIVVAIVGYLLVNWTTENQARILESFAVESEDIAELARQEVEVASRYRELATRAATEPLPFLSFGIVVIEHRNCFSTAERPDADSIQRIERLIALLLDGKFDAVSFARDDSSNG